MQMRADNAAHRADCRTQKSKVKIQGRVVVSLHASRQRWKKLKASKHLSSSRAKRANFPIRSRFWFTAPRKLKCCATRCRRAQKSRRKCATLRARKLRRCKCRRRRGSTGLSWICDEILRCHSVLQPRATVAAVARSAKLFCPVIVVDDGSTVPLPEFAGLRFDSLGKKFRQRRGLARGFSTRN